MKIVIARKAGFCYGVRRAVEIARKERESAGEKPVYTLGPLVHNPRVVGELEQDDVKSIGDPADYKPGRLIIRAHGVPPVVRDNAAELGHEIVDATCTLVKKIHDIVRKLDQEGYPVAVIGHAMHPEVTGIVGHARGECVILESPEDVEKIPFRDRLGVVVQTTFLYPAFLEIAAALPGKARELRIFNTICHATMERQESALELAKMADAMVVIGGKNSSNTQRLLEICLEVNPNSHHVESPGEIDPSWFRNGEITGVTAGASTPDNGIEDVINKIRKITGAGEAEKME